MTLERNHLIIADYFSKFPFVYPVRSSHHFKTIMYLWRSLHYRRCSHHCDVWQWPSIQWRQLQEIAREFNFIHTTSSPHFHQSNGFIEAMVKKVKNTYKKTMVHLQLKPEHYFSCAAPIVADLPSPAEILHGRPAQGAVIPRHPKDQFETDLAETDRNPDAQKFNRSHEQRISES